MKIYMKTAALVAAVAFLPWEASAGSRYNKKPRMTLDANVSAPWVLQLKTKYRPTAPKPQAGLRRKQRQMKVLRRATGVSVQRTASVPKPNKGLRRSMSPERQKELLPTVVSYEGNDKPGTLVVNTVQRRLYMVMEGGMARRYAIGVGKPGFEWRGTHKVTRKAEWPDWRPPAEMIARERKKGRELPKFMAGGPTNPLGARALYLGSTIYRIHGTTQNWSIGKAVSSGCIRMRNEDVMDLYDRIPVGTKVRVI